MHAVFNMVGRLFSSAVVFVVAYVVLMLPTYYLPYVGSNSAVLAGLGAATGMGLSPQFWMHVACLYFMIVITWLRGCQIGKQWIAIFPVIASIFDMVPGVNLVPLVPTAMHVCALIFGARGGSPENSSPSVPIVGGVFTAAGGAAVLFGLVYGFTWQTRLAPGPNFSSPAAKSETVARTPAPMAAAPSADARKADSAARPAQSTKSNIVGDWYGMGVRLKIIGAGAGDALKAKAWLATEKEPPTFVEVFPRQLGTVNQYVDKTNSFVIEVKAADFVDAQFMFPQGEGGETFIERFWRFQDPMNVDPLPGAGVPTGVASLNKR